MRQNFRENDQFDPLSDVHVLRGSKAILGCEVLLQELAERCDQMGAMHWLNYFFGGGGSLWKRPYLLLFLKPGANPQALQSTDIYAAALFYELHALGISTGAFSTDDWEGLRTVIAPPALRGQIAARAVNALIMRGAQVVLTTYRCTSMEEHHASMTLQRRGVLWTEYGREITKHRLTLEPTYDQTLSKFGKQTRFNLRYYRKRLLAKMDCEFLPDARTAISEAEAILLNTMSLNPVSEDECRRRYFAIRDLPGGFLIALRQPNGRLLSVLGGWRQGSTTVMHHQMNAAGFEKDSLGTVMRSFFLESEVERGTRSVIFYHGTNHTITHAFDTELLRDLVVCRKSLWAQALLKCASRIISPRFYLDTHYFGGSTTFLLGTLANGEAVWRSGPTARETLLAPKESAGL